MKKTFVLVLITAFSLCDAPQSVAFQPTATNEPQLNTAPERTERRRRKNRQRKGFMWGLFKKKSGCGCPNH